MKYTHDGVHIAGRRRSPQGERGLKWPDVLGKFPGLPSLPTGGAWIEMANGLMSSGDKVKSLPTGGAWIEIGQDVYYTKSKNVAPHRGSVD